jgi:hypothetical protein
LFRCAGIVVHVDFSGFLRRKMENNKINKSMARPSANSNQYRKR